MSDLRVEVLPDTQAAAEAAARHVAERARGAVGERGVFTLALSGGRTPGRMLEALARERVPWEAIHVFQVDERAAPRGDAERNLTQIEAALSAAGLLPRGNLHEMPVEEDDLEAGARRYEATLRALAGDSPIVDIVHLGLGEDGHTASLVPGDPAVAEQEADVAVTAPYQGLRRMTLTRPLLDRARCRLWLVTGAAKAPMLARLLAGDDEIPAGRIRRERAVVFADRPAAEAPGGTARGGSNSTRRE